jgi:hypothetical protein
MCGSGYSETAYSLLVGCASLRDGVDPKYWLLLDIGNHPFGGAALQQNLSVWASYSSRGDDFSLFDAEHMAPVRQVIKANQINANPAADRWYYLSQLWNVNGARSLFHLYST